jgi:hypothetical protein
VILLPVLYLLGLGPVNWLQANGFLEGRALAATQIFYSPLEWIVSCGPAWCTEALVVYINLWR